MCTHANSSCGMSRGCRIVHRQLPQTYLAQHCLCIDRKILWTTSWRQAAPRKRACLQTRFSRLLRAQQPSGDKGPNQTHMQLFKRGLHEALRASKGRRNTGSNDKVVVHMEDGRQLEWHFRRRDALQQVVLGCLLSTDPFGWLKPGRSEAALLQFPTTDLRNTYYLVRAGEGESEAADIVLTNPVAKTSMSSGLTPLGRQQVLRTACNLKAMGACSEGCWIWPSINQRAYQTAEQLGRLLGVGQSRIQPEYSFLDARGLGDLEGLSMAAATQQVVEGDGFSPDWRPPRGTDGTPNESVADVLVRVRQVLSITETQYRNTDIIIVSPDSDNLSILQAALLGADLRQHHRFRFLPGEVRAVQLSQEPQQYTTASFACPKPPRCIP